MNIEIITTPSNSLKETGFGAVPACIEVLNSIRRTENSVKLSVCVTKDDLDEVVSRNPDLVFLAAKYLPIYNGEDIWFSDFFSKNKITFSGSDRDTLMFDSDKVLAKLHLGRLGIHTASHFTAIPDEYTCQESLPLPFPLFIKPYDAANGNGIDELSFVNTFQEFKTKVQSIYDSYNQPALIEEYLKGREFTVAIIRKSNGEMTTSAIEILAPAAFDGLRILGHEVKKSNTESLLSIRNNDDINSVNTLAIESFLGLGCRGFGRIDVKMDSRGQCAFMEANLVPGMTLGSSYFPRACEIANNMNYDEVVNLMLEECLDRARSNKKTGMFQTR